MKKETLLIVLGVLVVLVPFFGIPGDWKKYTLIALGSIVVLIGVLMRYGLHAQNASENIDRTLFDDSPSAETNNEDRNV
jgi:hypothetical protein